MFRRFILSHPGLAAVLFVLALAMKLAVPAGYMPVAAPGQIMVMVCTAMGPQRVVIDVSGDGSGVPAQPDDAAADQPCVFAGLGQALLPSADAVQLAAALGFILALGFVAIALPPLGRIRQLRPPLRGPPRAA